MITFVGQPVAAPCPAKRVAGEEKRSQVGLFIRVLTPQPPLSGGLRRRHLVGLWNSRLPPDKVPALSLLSLSKHEGGQGGYLPGN